eukprot:14043394-Alexandrium_andersonii.AAC.1
MQVPSQVLASLKKVTNVMGLSVRNELRPFAQKTDDIGRHMHCRAEVGVNQLRCETSQKPARRKSIQLRLAE